MGTSCEFDTDGFQVNDSPMDLCLAFAFDIIIAKRATAGHIYEFGVIRDL